MAHAPLRQNAWMNPPEELDPNICYLCLATAYATHETQAGFVCPSCRLCYHGHCLSTKSYVYMTEERVTRAAMSGPRVKTERVVRYAGFHNICEYCREGEL